jgi:hypothetical protein
VGRPATRYERRGARPARCVSTVLSTRIAPTLADEGRRARTPGRLNQPLSWTNARERPPSQTMTLRPRPPPAARFRRDRSRGYFLTVFLEESIRIEMSRHASTDHARREASVR